MSLLSNIANSGFRAAALAFALVIAAAARAQDDAPKPHDPRLLITRFAAAPDIVQPINCAIDHKGRLLVIESHTHFRPQNYNGPPHDRVRILEDTDGDGKADRFTTFFEGTRATMDIAVHPDGAVYLASRNEILRLRDTKGDGKADVKERIVFLDTKGDYPHNGLSGLAFDSKGNLYFGMGENLGADYKLIGSDGTTLTGGGEGGNIFWCSADGKQLRRVATGFWNPFGVCTDIFGRVFAVDNDPDAMPPCRMLHVVEGGDYGYQFRYGRSGRHPFQSWHGQLYGTLPMVTGVGEAPCKLLSYESDGLPREMLGDLLVASWADHRIERYTPKEKGASVTAEQKPFIQGGKDFRPVGIAVAPDGSLFITDWVLSDYNLHGRGAVWHVRMKDAPKLERPSDPVKALASAHRPLREAAARTLAAEFGGIALRAFIGDENVRIRSAALTALCNAGDRDLNLSRIASSDPVTPVRALAVRAMVARAEDAIHFLDARYPPAVRLEAVAMLRSEADRRSLLQLLADNDPFLRSAAIQQLARTPGLVRDVPLLPDARQRMGFLLALRASASPSVLKAVPGYLRDPDPEVRFLAAKWIADEKLAAFRPQIVEALKDPHLSVRHYLAYSTALARIDGQEVSEGRMAEYFVGTLKDPNASPALQVAALRQVPATHPTLKLETLTNLLKQDDAYVRLESVRALNEHPDRRRVRALLEIAKNAAQTDEMRADAIVGIAAEAQENAEALIGLAQSESSRIRDEAIRALSQVQLDTGRKEMLERVSTAKPQTADLVARVLGRPFVKDRPSVADTAAWLNRLEGPADVDVGRRIFFHPRLGYCSRCHRIDGRGADIGPDLSDIGRTERRHILESILQPDLIVAPNYQMWALEMKNGKVLTGMLMKTVLDEYTYVDTQGVLFKVNTRDIAESRPLPKSIMPGGLADLLTDQELRDLLAYLCSRR
jgi:putative membrane-bound dehydrogenase-like protein